MTSDMTSTGTQPAVGTQGRTFRAVWERYGGGDIPATIGGLLAAIGTLLGLAGLLAAGAGSIAYQMGVLGDDGAVEEVSLAGAAVAIAVVFVAFVVGGWVAARMARFDGVKNGLIVALWMLTLVVVFGALGIWAGEEYNVFAQMGLPDWVSQWDNADVTAAAAIAGSLGALAMFAGGYVGGLVGDAYNVRVNAALANATYEPIVH